MVGLAPGASSSTTLLCPTSNLHPFSYQRAKGIPRDEDPLPNLHPAGRGCRAQPDNAHGDANAWRLGVSRGMVSVSSVTHGMRLTLSMDHEINPRNGLVRAQVTVKNMSHQTIPVIVNACLPMLRVDSVSRTGKPVSTNQDWFPASCGPFRRPQPLRPGAIVRADPITVLATPRLRAYLTFQSGKSQNDVEVSSRTLTLRLRSEAAPHVSERSMRAGQGSGFTAKISPAPSGHRLLYTHGHQSCWQANGTGQESGSFPGQWTAISGSTLRFTTPKHGCRTVLWEFTAGWIGHPVVHFKLSIPRGQRR